MLNDEDFETAKDNLELSVRKMVEGVKSLLKQAESLRAAHDEAERTRNLHAEHAAVHQFLGELIRVEERMDLGPRLVTSELNTILIGVMRVANAKRDIAKPAEDQPGPEQ